MENVMYDMGKYPMYHADRVDAEITMMDAQTVDEVMEMAQSMINRMIDRVVEENKELKQKLSTMNELIDVTKWFCRDDDDALSILNEIITKAEDEA